MVKKYIDVFARYGGLVTVCLEWLAVASFFVLKPAYFDGEHTVSYFASLPETKLFFSVCLTMAAFSFWLFAKYHLNYHYKVPVRLFEVSMLGYAALALTPFDPNDPVSHVLHRIFALVFSTSYFAAIYLMGKHNAIMRKVSYGVVVVGTAALLAFLALPSDSKLILPLEALGAIVGQVWAVWVSFYALQRKKLVTND